MPSMRHGHGPEHLRWRCAQPKQISSLRANSEVDDGNPIGADDLLAIPRAFELVGDDVGRRAGDDIRAVEDPGGAADRDFLTDVKDAGEAVVKDPHIYGSALRP